MNKTLLTLAIGAAMVAAPFISVQAAPTLYGQIHVSVENLNDDSVGTVNDTNIAQSSNSSRIGVKGEEAVANGLSAFYQAEWQVDAGSDTNLASRNQFAGLKGDFGAITIGKRDSAVKDLGGKVDLFWRAQIGENRNFTSTEGFDSRWDNTIMYTTPSINGLQGNLAYITDTSNGTPDDNDNDATIATGTYNNGPIFAGLGYEVHNRLAANTSDESVIRLVGSYMMNAWKFVGLWQSVSDNNYVNGADRDVWGLGTAYKMGMTTFKGQYYVADDVDGAGNANTGATMISVGVDHSLSANTTVYAAYAKTSNESAATFGVSGAGHDDGLNNVIAAGRDPSALAVGLRIMF